MPLGLRYYRIVGRFHRLRRLIAALWGLGQRWADGRAGAPGGGPAHHAVNAGRVGAWVDELQSRGFCIGPRLGAETVAAIRRYAEERPCSLSGTRDRFLISDVRDGRTPAGTAVAVADVTAPLDCPEIAWIAGHPLLVETTTRVLGYRPRRTQVRLFWSPASRLPCGIRRAAGQTVDFHYDIDACNSLNVYFYVVGGGPGSGAHVVVGGSHGPKPMRMIAGSCFQPEERVLARYGAENVIVVAGIAGLGFFEDPACFHKALIPTQADRLCLQVRYS